MSDTHTRGKTIHDTLVQKEKSEAELAALLECTQEQLSRIYSGEEFLSYDQLVKVAKYLGVSARVLLKKNSRTGAAKKVEKSGVF